MRPLFLGILCGSLALVALSIGVIAVQGFGDDGQPDVRASTTETPPPTDATPAATPAASPGVAGPTGNASGPAGHEGARALAIVKELADEARVSGTPAEALAAEYIAGLFRSYGYSTEIMQFEFDGDRFRAGEVALGPRRIETLTLAGSPGGQVAAASVYVGLADAAGIAGRDLAGKVAVADRGTLTFADKYENVRAAGAVGLVVVNNRPGPFSGNLTTTAAIPVVSVSQEDGEAVLKAARAGETIGISAPATTGLTKALNVIAMPPGTSACKILVGGHFDSVPSAPGANDNASGTANVLELARASAADGLDEGLCFATFGAEESGLYGSKALVERMKKAGTLPSYMINLDVTGIGKTVEVIGDSELARDALATATAEGIPAVASQLPANSGSDHQSFIDAGVPTVFFTSGDFATIHSPQDVTEDISEVMLDQVGDAAFALIKGLLAEVARG